MRKGDHTHMANNKKMHTSPDKERRNNQIGRRRRKRKQNVILRVPADRLARLGTRIEEEEGKRGKGERLRLETNLTKYKMRVSQK